MFTLKVNRHTYEHKSTGTSGFPASMHSFALLPCWHKLSLSSAGSVAVTCRANEVFSELASEQNALSVFAVQGADFVQLVKRLYVAVVLASSG